MDKYEKRRRGLLRLRDVECGGKTAELARRMDRVDSYVARLLYPEGKVGRKRIGGDMAELIERAFHLSRGGLEGDIQDDRPLHNVAPRQVPLLEGECPEFCVQGGLKFHCLQSDFTPPVS